MRLVLFFSALLLTSQSALAHIGHVGELAGHGHWVAVGAIVTAAALAALLAKTGKKEADNEPEEESEPEGEAATGEA